MKLSLPKLKTVAKGYRMFLVSGLSVLFGVLALVDWNAFLNDWKAGVVSIVMGLVMGGMRLITDTPPGESEHPDTKIVEQIPPIIVSEAKEKIKKDIEAAKK